MTGRREAILYYSHIDSPAVRREIARLRNEIGPKHDLFVTGFCQIGGALSRIPHVAVRPYYLADLQALPYPAKLSGFNPSETLGNNDLVLLRFFLDHPGYEYYWVIEYDVRLSGHWSDLLANLAPSPADLLCTTLRRYAEAQYWPHWHGLRTGSQTIFEDDRIRGFLPFCRISRAALQAVDERYRADWAGHAEAVWPTAVHCAGLILEDVGAFGSFTPQHRRGRYYTSTPINWAHFPGTFIYRPAFSDSNLFGPDDPYGNDLLWHPVKE